MTIRRHRVKAFCDWLASVPPHPPFHTLPEFRFYSNLTSMEMEEAQIEMESRATRALAKAESLVREANGQENGDD